jgi:serine/threonine protein kinase/tetratricopeptide (TPR) repeat protein
VIATPEHWQKVKQVLAGALEREPSERSAYLDLACTEPSVRREVESLISAHEQTDSRFLELPAVEEPTLKSGTRLGSYEILELLGVGGMGEVYKAHDTKLMRDVAIKVLPAAFVNDSDRLSRFQREARILAALNHPNIATIHGLEQSNGVHYLVMELVSGETLAERLRAGPLEIREALRISRQIAEALEAAHEKAMVHRDLKPANVKVTPEGRVKVLDFGLGKAFVGGGGFDLSTGATFTEMGTEDGRILGTPAYMSPEQARGKAVDKRTDIWAFGCVLYELLTARRAFCGETIADTIAAVLERDPDWHALPSSTPAKIQDLLRRCLQKDLQRRLRDFGDARIEIEEAQRSELAVELLADPRAVQRSPQSERQQKYSPTQKQKKLVGLSLSLLLAIGLSLAGIVLWRKPKLGPPIAPRVRVAVLPFLNQTGDDQLGRYRLALAQVLVLDLTGSPNIQVLSYERLLDITRGFEEEGKDFSSPEAVKAVASYGNSQFVVVPAMFAIGKTLQVSAEFRDAQTGQTVGATKVEHALVDSPGDTLYSMLGPLEDGIQAYFKNVRSGAAYQSPPESSRPKTVTAALHVNEGRYAFARGSYAQALNSFQEAIKEDSEFALPYAWSGQIDGLLGYDDKAREFSTKAAALIRPDTPVTEAYFIEANLDERKYDLSSAAQKYLELIRLFPDDPEWHARLAEVYDKQGQYVQAISSYQRALGQDPNYIVADEQLGSLFSRTGDLPQAISHAQKALDLYGALSQREGQASALLVLGEALRLKSDYEQASRCAESALELSKALGNEFGSVRATKLLGDVSFSEGHYEKARRDYQQVLSASNGIHNNYSLVLALMNIGVSYSREGDLARAAEYYRRSLAQEKLYGEYKDWPSLRGRAMALSNLGSIFIDYGPQPAQGLQFVQESLPIFQMMKNPWWTARDQALLGLYDTNIGKYGEALDQLQQSQTVYRSISALDGLAAVKFDIARGYFLQNEYEQALVSFADALNLAQEAKSGSQVANSQVHLAWTYARLGDTARARALLTEASQSARKNGIGELLPDVFNVLGELYWEMGDRHGARQNLQRASALWKGPHVSEYSIEARSTLGLLEAEEGNSSRGIVHCQEALARAREDGRVHTLARTATNLARVHVLRKEYGKAIEVLDEITPLAMANLGLELRAQLFYYRGKAAEGLGKTQEANASYSDAENAIRKLEDTLATSHRNDFAARREIRVLLR